MLTFLSVEKRISKSLFPLRNKIIQEIRCTDAVDVKHIRYIQKNKKINWDKILKCCIGKQGLVLCDEDLQIPEGCGIARFYSDELRVRLCLNMAIEVLKMSKELPKGFKMGIYDPDGRIADGAGALLRYIPTVYVTTRTVDLYSAEAQRIMDESGAVLSVSRRMKALSDAQLVIAPVKLKVQLPLAKQAIILTTQPPAVSQKCAVYHRYYFSLTEELIKLLPEGFDAEYLASALYTLYGRFDLGSTVPQATKGTGAAHTLLSMSKYLINISQST